METEVNPSGLGTTHQDGGYEAIADEALSALKDAPADQATEADSTESGQEQSLEEERTPEDIAKELSDAEDDDQSESEEDQPETESAEEEEPEEGSESDEELYEVKVAGETQKVTLDELREGYQREADYRRKTQELSDERKAYESESEQAYTDLETRFNQLQESEQTHVKTLQLAQQRDSFLAQLENSDPGLFQDIQNRFQQFTQQYNNPVIQDAQTKIQSLEERIETMGQEREDEQIRKEFETDLSATKDKYRGAIEKLGLKVDWDKVKQNYIDGAKTVGSAFLQEYGDQLMTRYESRQKVENTKRRAEAARKAPTVATTNRGKTTKTAPDSKNMDYEDVAFQAARELGVEI